jgi:hypothetical protein
VLVLLKKKKKNAVNAPVSNDDNTANTPEEKNEDANSNE